MFQLYTNIIADKMFVFDEMYINFKWITMLMNVNNFRTTALIQTNVKSAILLNISTLEYLT